MAWFEVNKEGLAAILDARGRGWALFELLQNAWDSGASVVRVTVEPLAGSPFVRLTVTDDSPDGWSDLSHAFQLFGKSSRAGDAEKRGRFCMGEKLVLAVCRSATIETMQGTVAFLENGERTVNRNPSARRMVGTRFECEMRMTRTEMADLLDQSTRLVPPVPTYLNETQITGPLLLSKFEATLPTVVTGEDGVPRKTKRQCVVEVYDGEDGGEVLEMGIPVCALDCPWRLNVLQKVPLNMERDSITDSFRSALLVTATNMMADHLTDEQAAQPWVSAVMADPRISADALKETVVKRFGENAVVAVPGDPVANAAAAAAGATLIHGGALPSGAWANLRKADFVPTSSRAFPGVPMGDRVNIMDAMAEVEGKRNRALAQIRETLATLVGLLDHPVTIQPDAELADEIRVAFDNTSRI